MIELEKVNTYFKKDNRTLLENFDLVLNKSDKCAIIGLEGIGKTTFLKLLYNEHLIDDYCSYNGKIIRDKVNYQFLDHKLSNEWNDCLTAEFFFKDEPQSILKSNYPKDMNIVISIFNKYNIKTDLLAYGKK